MICVASLSGAQSITRDYQTHFGLSPDAIYGWDLPKEHQKPNPYPVLDFMERHQLKPEEVLVVDDMKLGWRMARSAGVEIAFSAWSKEDFPELTKEMRSLCDHSFDTPGQLERFLFD